MPDRAHPPLRLRRTPAPAPLEGLQPLHIGVFYKSDVNELKSRLDKAAESNSVIVFFSHNIAPDAKHIHMPTEMLEELLAHAQKLNLQVIGFDQLNTLK